MADQNDVKPVKFKPTPKSGQNIGIDTDKSLVKLLANDEGISQALDTSSLTNFRNISDRRELIYSTFDEMAKDIVISSALDLYADDATEYNEEGKVIWAESDNDEIKTHVNYLLTSLKLDETAWQHVHALCKYGDLYLETFRLSDLTEKTIGKENVKSNTKQLTESIKDENMVLTEDIIVNIYKDTDRLQEYIEMVSNPAEIFDLTKRGKTVGFLKTNIQAKQNDMAAATMMYEYNFNNNDIELYDPTKYVHVMLPDTSLRQPEEVKLFNIYDEKSRLQSGLSTDAIFNVKRGKSVLYDLYKIYREVRLLEDSILLNRVTRSALVRILQVEVGDMGKNQVQQLLQRVKTLFEQKSAINDKLSMQEYNNPAPIENNVYVPTRNGLGSITPQTMGGDFNVGQLFDLDFFNNKLFAGLKVPKQYLGFTDDNAGFSGGESLMRINSRYAKTIKRVKNAYMQGIKTLINIFLLDKGLDSYVNKFTIKMQSPSTQEDTERTEAQQTKLSIISDTMNLLSDIDDPVTKLSIIKAMLGDVITDSTVTQLLDDYIKELKENPPVPETPEGGDDLGLDIDNIGGPSSGPEVGPGSAPISDLGSDDSLEAELNDLEDSEPLPNPSDLNIDMTDNDISDNSEE